MSVCLSQKSLIHGKINMTLVVYYSPRDEVHNALEINWELDAVLCNIYVKLLYIPYHKLHGHMGQTVYSESLYMLSAALYS